MNGLLCCCIDGLFEETTLDSLVDSVKDGSALYYGHCFNETMKIYSNSPGKLTHFFCYRSMICHQAMVFERKAIVDKLYDTSYRVCADRELLLYMVVKSKLPTKYLSLVIARYKGSGFCETEENRERIRKENKLLKEKYFSPFKRVIYFIAYHATLPLIRKFIVSNKKTSKAYKKAVSKIYRNKCGNNNGL